MTVGPGVRTASVRASGQAMPGGYGASKEGPDRREEKSPEGSNPRSGPGRNVGKARRGSRRREGSNPEDATAGDVGVPGTYRILCVDDRWRERDPRRGAEQRPLKGGEARRRISGHALKDSGSPRTDGNGIRKGAGARRREEGLQEPGSREPRLKQAVAKPETSHDLARRSTRRRVKQVHEGTSAPAVTLVGTAGNTTWSSGGETPHRHRLELGNWF